MCGITGIFNINGSPVASGLVKRMADQLRHRGPDGEGIFEEYNCALGHRRLAILDTSSLGAQPMHSHNKEWVVVFNGCIYNYHDIKKDLQQKGHSFVSTTDTEVITEGLAEYGVDIFKKFNGMFAIAAYHRPTKKLYLSRDRFGVKPLYYFIKGNTVLFGSEIKSFFPHPDFKTELNPEALGEYFTFQNLFSFRSLFKGVVLLPPANTVVVDSNTSGIIKHISWWDYNFNEEDKTISFEDAREETKRLLSVAVERQMISDVPVGGYLSGGMDSGSLVALASTHVDRLTTFTAGFDMSRVTGTEANFDERRDAELMANYFKTEHYEQVINAGDLRWSLPRVVYHLEDLRVGMSYPNYYISRLASKFVKVCLQGTGGDELFGGYPWRYYHVSGSLDQQNYFNNYYGFWQRLVPDNDKNSFFTEQISAQIDNSEPRKIFERVFQFNKALRYDTPENHINNSLYFESKTFLHGLLMVGDKLSMANGLEERFPFLDNDLVNFAQQVPIKYKLANLEEMKRIDENESAQKRKFFRDTNDGKNVLRKAMSDLIPEAIINRKKQGFSAPDESWYRGENAQYVKELLLDKNAAYKEYINPKYVENVIHEHIDKRINHRLLIWSLMNFEWWCRIFLKNEVVI
jgi:asparagine synthase (glutamine-hydrolysing)